MRTHGFTLIEVMVALAIVAVALVGMVKITGEASNGATIMREQVLAEMVALNRIEALRLSTTPPQASDSGTEEMAGMEWTWNQVSSETTQVDVLKVEVSAARTDNPSASASVSTFIGLTQPVAE